MVKSRRARMAAEDNPDSATESPPANQGSHLRRGAAARTAAKTEAARAREGNGPWRFWLKNSTDQDPKTKVPVNECDIIILDESLDSIVGMHEHNLKINGKRGNFEGCPKEFDNCCLCDKGEYSYYGCFFSVLVLRPWVSKDGKKSGKCTKMLLCVKSAQMAKFEEYCLASEKSNGKLRGTYFYMKRDTSNANSAGQGEPCILENDKMFDFYSEEDLVQEYGHEAETSNQGKILKKVNEDITAYDYTKLFKKPDANALRERYGNSPQAGSSQEASQNWGDGQQAEPAEERVASPRRRPAPGLASEVSKEADPFAGEQSTAKDEDNIPF